VFRTFWADGAAAAEGLAQKAKQNLGHVVDARTSPEGYLEVTLEVPGEDDAKRLPSVRFVSPEITRDYTDGDGRVWRGQSITHVAVTPRPVQHRQKPFAAARLSLDRVVRLALEGYEMADKENEATEGEEKTGGDLSALIDALRETGMTIPDEVSDISGLIIAVKAAGGVGGNTDEGEATAGPAAEELTPPVQMSLDKRSRAVEARLIKQERASLGLRIGNLLRSGRINRPLHDRLVKEANTVRLSLGEDGEPSPCKLLMQVEAYEALPTGKTFGQDRLSLEAVEVQPPEHLRTGPKTESETEQAVKDWDAMMGRK
jgi:hypothetical protein